MMKVKANYSISCDKGDFCTGDIFEIKACDLPMYGDAVAVVENDPAVTATPEVPEKAQAETATEEPKAEKPKTSSTRRKKISEEK